MNEIHVQEWNKAASKCDWSDVHLGWRHLCRPEVVPYTAENTQCVPFHDGWWSDPPCLSPCTSLFWMIEKKWAMGKILSKTFCIILRLWIKFKNTYHWTINTYSPSCYRSPRPRRGRPPPCHLASWSYYLSRKSQACQSSQATGKTPPKF